MISIFVMCLIPAIFGALLLEDKAYWSSIGHAELDVNKITNGGVAKNVIIFIGDGMGPSTVTAARIFQGQHVDDKGERSSLSFENFPYTGLSKTYNSDKQVTDSAAAATAIFTGVKTKQGQIGVDSQAPDDPCYENLMKESYVDSMMTWAQEKGKDTGIVTTTAVTDATPAGTYAHIIERDWECDGEIPNSIRHCVKDVARQLVEDSPGKNFKVILGGGRKAFGMTFHDDPDDPLCSRTDGKNLVDAWKIGKTNLVFAKTKDDLEKVNPHVTDHLLGLFAPGDLPYVAENVTTTPSLALMTEKAIQILQKNKNGFFLMVEGGRIDHAHHQNFAKLSLIETLEFSKAIAEAVKLTNSDDTLIVVTADHSHPLVISGYPKRGDNILGYGENNGSSFFETLLYGNGPGYADHHNKPDIASCLNCSPVEYESISYLRDLRNNNSRDRNNFDRHFSAFYRTKSAHGGEDVAIYAQGPMAHLFSGVHEQNFIAHAVSYVARVGPHEKRQMLHLQSNAASDKIISAFAVLAMLIFA